MALADYELLEEIGAGSVGVVYRARQRSLDRIVALKVLRAVPAASPSDVRRFYREAAAVARLDHPSIVPIYNVGSHNGQHFLSMKLIEGRDLTSHVADLRADPRQTARILAKVARAMHHAHQRGIIHRDLKPSNILLEGRAGDVNPPVPYVADFGLALRVEDGPSLTTTGVILGTPAYMAPEQARGCRDLTPAVDVYSLGAVLYELLTGRVPFEGETPYQALLAVERQRPPLPRWLNRRVSRDLEAVCLKCLQKDPGRRYPSAEQLAEDLERAANGRPVHAPRIGLLSALTQQARRRSRAVALAALLAVLAVAAGRDLLVPRPTAAEVQAEVQTYQEVMRRAHEAQQEGNYALFLELMDRHRGARHERSDAGWEFLYKQDELVRRLGWVRTLEIPAPVWKDSRPQVGQPAPYSWTAEGNRLVTAWGTVVDPATGKETGSSGGEDKPSKLDYQEGIDSTDGSDSKNVQKVLKGMYNLEFKDILEIGNAVFYGAYNRGWYNRSNVVKKTTWARLSPDRTRLLTGVGDSPYWNVWDLTRWKRPQ